MLDYLDFNLVLCEYRKMVFKSEEMFLLNSVIM